MALLISISGIRLGDRLVKRLCAPLYFRGGRYEVKNATLKIYSASVSHGLLISGPEPKLGKDLWNSGDFVGESLNGIPQWAMGVAAHRPLIGILRYLL